SLAWTAITFALVGFVPTFPLLVALACASGLGSGAFHPFGALDVRALLPKRSRSAGMSIYVTAGTVGVAIGPLIGIGLFSWFGLHGTGWLVIPGVATGAYRLWRMRKAAPSGATERKAAPASRQVVPMLAIAAVIGVMMSRSWTVQVFQTFTPTWYKDLGYVTGALGVPINGAIGDAIGLQKSLMTHVILVVVTIGVAWLLPTESEMEKYSAVAIPPTEALKPSVVA